jgi:hypothetical protein
MILYESKNFSVQNFVLICAKDQQVVRFVIFDEVLESISCFVINGDNRFDPYRVHHFLLNNQKLDGRTHSRESLVHPPPTVLSGFGLLINGLI